MKANNEMISTSEMPQISQISLSERRFWHERVFVLFSMLKWMRGRETVFLMGLDRTKNIRYLNLGKVEMLMNCLGIRTQTEKIKNKAPKDQYKFLSTKKNYNIYCSLGKIDWVNCPVKVFSYNQKQREKQKKIFKEKLTDYMYDFTGAIDFDGDQDIILKDGKEVKVDLDISQEEALNRSLNDLKATIKIFEDYGIKYFVQFSGSRGFHLFWEIPMEITKDCDIYQKVDFVNDIVKTIRETLDLKTIDRARYNTRKVFKCPYSLVTKNNITRVCLPLSREQIKDFNLDMVLMKNVYKNVRDIKERGFVWRYEKLVKDELIDNFRLFMNDFELKIPEKKEY